ncbi:type I restriction-modification system subunit M [Actinoplanes sp. KI2]|uniref:type I restriction-modification system subunit M n=1 Tax=Actinoplanes sp. KI2 TaxID=2983315 RepID=UPI0021D5A2DA|nr:class I SAM-dependent DNA methyltransferase [Actinoplanes sp. KI2]MCU7726201.1 type I restriction-modification system subunit M [Actinoplanes sp. KI2]
MKAGVSRTREIQELLWRAAEKLRGSVDAGQYKEFILGLVFLKHVSDMGALGVRWADLAGGDGAKLDAAMDSIMRDNPALAGVLPKVFRSLDQGRLAELVALIGDARFAGEKRDVLGESYEYFLERFARAEGKRAGEFYTPAGVVRLLVEVLEPDRGVVYDPCCGSGGMFVQSAKVKPDLSVRGQESNERTWRLAKMNLAIHGMDPSGLGDRWGDTFANDLHPGLRADFILANPPFNQSDWQRDPHDPRWRFGVPPLSNANFAWLQLIAAKLAGDGSAGVVLSNGSMSSRQMGEGTIRAALVRADLVACMVALPANLFRTTAIPACVWFLARNKSARRGQILFVDARGLGTMVDRTERILTTSDIARIAGTYRAWRSDGYEDVPGFCFSASVEEVAEQDYVLNPGRYVGTVARDEETEPVADRIERLTKELYAQFEESARLEAMVRDQLGRLHD